VGPRASLDAVAEKINPCSSWESKSGRQARSLVTIPTEEGSGRDLF
jgi:hypothetical protein